MLGNVRLATIVFALVLFAADANATTCPPPSTLSNGQTADANDLLNIFNCINGNFAPLAGPHFAGNVGIGTTTPTNPLTLSGGSAGTPSLSFGDSGTGIFRSELDSLAIANGGTESWHIDASGNIVMGSLTWYNMGKITVWTYGGGVNALQFGGYDIPLGVIGGASGDRAFNAGYNADFRSATDYKTGVKNEVYDTTAIISIGNAGFRFLTAPSNPGGTTQPFTEVVTILNSGNVGIGTSAPSYPLTVNGTAYATGAAGALSDRRHKNDIEPLPDNAVTLVMRLKPVRFSWKDPRDDGMRGRQIGFIAQDVQPVLPDVVLTMNDRERTLGLKYDEFIPVLAKAIQEQQGEIAALNARLDRDDRALASALAAINAVSAETASLRTELAAERRTKKLRTAIR
jgi:hypothetical protein